MFLVSTNIFHQAASVGKYITCSDQLVFQIPNIPFLCFCKTPNCHWYIELLLRRHEGLEMLEIQAVCISIFVALAM